MARITNSYGLSSPLEKVFPQPIVSSRAPTSADINYPIGQLWVDKSADQAWFLTSVSAGSATYALASPGASDVDTLTGSSGGAISPVAGNIDMIGGTNLTSVGTAGTITFNLDAAITLATSVSSPLYTAAAATDVAIDAPTGQDVLMTLGDNAGTNKLSILDSDSVEVFAVDSNGGLTFTTLTVTDAFTQSGGAASINASSNFNTAINTGTSTGTVTIGNTSSGAIAISGGAAVTVDSVAGISIDAATASNFTVTGAAQDLTLASSGGSVNVTSTENAAQAIYLHANGGTSETVQLHADQGTGVSSVYLLSDVGGITVESAGLASADAINLVATAGGIDMDGALQVNIASSQDAGDAISLNSSAGGMELQATGEAGQDITILNTGGSVIVSATEAIADSITVESTAGGIDILASGAGAGLDIDIINTGGSINLTATEADAGALSLSAASGGMAVSLGLALIADAAGNIELNSSAGQILIGNDAVNQNISIGTAGTREVTVGSTTSTSGLTLQAGTGNITATGTFEAIDAKLIRPTGFDITLTASPTTCTAADTAGVATGTTGATNLLSLQEGVIMEQFILGAGQTIIKPVMDTSGLLISGDLTDTEGFEYNFGAARTLSSYAFTIGTSAAFYFEATLTIADISGGNPYMIGFRKAEANNATFANYTDYYGLGMFGGTSATNVTLVSELNSGGQTLQDSGTAWTGGDGGTVTLKILVSASGVVTATIDGGGPSTPLAYTFDNADVVCPFIRITHGAVAPGTVHLVDMNVGFQ